MIHNVVNVNTSAKLNTVPDCYGYFKIETKV